MATAAQVRQAAQPGGLARMVSGSGEDRIDIIAELLVAAVQTGQLGAGAAILRQTTVPERGQLLTSAQFRTNAGAAWPGVLQIIRSVPGSISAPITAAPSSVVVVRSGDTMSFGRRVALAFIAAGLIYFVRKA